MKISLVLLFLKIQISVIKHNIYHLYYFSLSSCIVYSGSKSFESPFEFGHAQLRATHSRTPVISFINTV